MNFLLFVTMVTLFNVVEGELGKRKLMKQAGYLIIIMFFNDKCV